MLAARQLATDTLWTPFPALPKPLLDVIQMAPAFNSPFSEHIRTNYVPSSREKAHISQLLVAPQQEVSALDAEIAELQKKFDEIKARRDGLSTIVTEHRRLLTPFRRVPDNILKAIFIHCLPTDRNANMVSSEAPFLLPPVCKRWRDVAYDTPGLWATLHIAHIPLPTNALLEAEFSTREYPITSEVRRHLHAIAQWLDRSGTCPLSLSIHSSDDTVDFHLYLQLLLSFSHRWLDFEVLAKHKSASLDLATLASISSDAFPILEGIYLTFPNKMEENTPSKWKTHSGILQGKNLRSISVNNFPYDLANVETNWSGLTSLVLCDPYSAKRKSAPSEAHIVLSHCVNLRRLTMAIYDPSSAGVQFTTPYFYLPHLQSFSIYDHYYHLAVLFDGIDAPSLNQVCYSTPFGPSNVRRSPLIALLSRNGQLVDSLTTDILCLSLANIADCFRMTPFLCKFVSNVSHIVESEGKYVDQETPITPAVSMGAIFEMLTPTSSDGQCYWPRLQVIETTNSTQLNDQIVLTFIQKRMAAAEATKSKGDPILPLKEVSINFCLETEIDIASLLEEYTRNGLRLNFYDHRNGSSRSASLGRFDSCAGINNCES